MFSLEMLSIRGGSSWFGGSCHSLLSARARCGQGIAAVLGPVVVEPVNVTDVTAVLQAPQGEVDLAMSTPVIQNEDCNEDLKTEVRTLSGCSAKDFATSENFDVICRNCMNL